MGMTQTVEAVDRVAFSGIATATGSGVLSVMMSTAYEVVVVVVVVVEVDE